MSLALVIKEQKKILQQDYRDKNSGLLYRLKYLYIPISIEIISYLGQRFGVNVGGTYFSVARLDV